MGNSTWSVVLDLLIPGQVDTNIEFIFIFQLSVFCYSMDHWNNFQHQNNKVVHSLDVQEGTLAFEIWEQIQWVCQILSFVQVFEN